VGETGIDPDWSTLPTLGLMFTDVALITFHDNVELCPNWIWAGSEVKNSICTRAAARVETCTRAADWAPKLSVTTSRKV
jgi:hypothetical protein